MMYPFSDAYSLSHVRYFSGINAVKFLTPYHMDGFYYSPIFQLPANATLENISWTEGVPYQKELLNNRVDENVLGGIDMGSNVLLMHMNEASGQITDHSGSGNDGTTHGGITYNTAGKFNKALSFDGVNDYVSFPNIDFPSSGSTVSLWFKYNTINRGLLGRSGDADTYIGYLVSKSIIAVQTNTRGTVKYFTVPAMSSNTWYHLIVTRNSGVTRLYLNSIESSSGGQSQTNTLTINQIGRYDVGGHNWNGKIDEVSIFTRVLSSQEIEDMYKRGALKLNMTIKSCTSEYCGGAPIIDIPDESPQDLTHINTKNYAAFIAFFTTEKLPFSPELHNVTLVVSVLDMAPTLRLYPLRVDEDTQIRRPTIDLRTCAYDRHTPIDKLNFTIESQSNGILDCRLEENRYIECDPLLNENGQKNIRISVTDESNNTAYGNMTITVNPMNDLPEITNLPVNLNAKEGEEINFNNVE
ncbi:hypothetical protein KAU15_04725, partial [candidate division WOR-3 bacterium]|nr:hypothetical protein [candidate division WOR-3 bacterium]